MRKMKMLICLLVPVFLAINTGAFGQQNVPSNNSAKVDTLSKEGLLKANQDLQDKLVKLQQKEDRGLKNVIYAGIVLVFVITLMIILLYIANKSRDKMLKKAEEDGDTSEVTTFLIRQSLGLPQGSLRGIIAIVVASTFISAIFFYGSAKDIPDSFKIIVSLVFGYYFSKSENQTKQVIDAMLGKTKQEALKKQQLESALAEARFNGAEEFPESETIYEEAKKLTTTAENEQNTSKRLQIYSEALTKAMEAKEKAKELKQSKAESEQKVNMDKFNELSRRISSRIGDLKAVKTNKHIIEGLENGVRDADWSAQNKNFTDALKILESINEKIDGLLVEYDEAEKQFKALAVDTQSKIEDDLKDALDSFNNSFVNEITGDNDELIESIVRMQGAVKEQDSKLLSVLRKRFLGLDFENKDILEVVQDVKNRGDKTFIRSVLEASASKIGAKLTDKIREKIEAPEIIEKLLLGSEDEKGELFKEIFAKNGVDDKGLFDGLISNVKKDVVDNVLGDKIKQALPDGISFDSIKKLLKGAQEDRDGKSVLSKVEKVLNVGETILSFTPVSGAAKAVGMLVRGIFKVFGKNKKE